MKSLSLRARLTLWYTVTLVLVLGVFGGDVLVEQKRLGVRRADQELGSAAATLANIFREEMRGLDTPATAAMEAKNAMRSLGDEIGIFDATGRPLATQLDRLTLADIAPSSVAPAATINTRFGEWRVRTQPLTVNAGTFTL